MKKQFLLLATALLVGTTTMYAQGGFQRQTPEERLKPIHEKIDSAFKLTAEKLAKVDSVFLESFKQQEAKMAELRSGGERPDREAMMAMRQQLADERDNKFKRTDLIKYSNITLSDLNNNEIIDKYNLRKIYGNEPNRQIEINHTLFDKMIFLNKK